MGDELLPVDEALRVGDPLQTGDLKPLPNRFVRMSTADAEDSVANRTATARLQEVSDAHEDVAASGEILPAIPAHLDFLFADRPLLPDE